VHQPTSTCHRWFCQVGFGWLYVENKTSRCSFHWSLQLKVNNSRCKSIPLSMWQQIYSWATAVQVARNNWFTVYCWRHVTLSVYHVFLHLKCKQTVSGTGMLRLRSFANRGACFFTSAKFHVFGLRFCTKPTTRYFRVIALKKFVITDVKLKLCQIRKIARFASCATPVLLATYGLLNNTWQS